MIKIDAVEVANNITELVNNIGPDINQAKITSAVIVSVVAHTNVALAKIQTEIDLKIAEAMKQILNV